MKDRIISLIITAACFAVAFAVAFFAERKYGQKPPQIVVKEKVDTLIIHDTIRFVEPKYVTVRVVDTLRVPVPVPGKTDTVWAELPREQKVYRDYDNTYRAVVSGVEPKLDSIEVYQKTVYVDKEVERTVYVEPSRWGIGLSAGYGLSKSGLSPYIGIGVQYNLWSPKRRITPP